MSSGAPPSFPSDEDESPSSVKSARQIIAVGGGRGGAGKSLLAANLAVYFAQLGKSVLLVDADATGANLHTHFGLRAATDEPSLDERDPNALKRALVNTSVPGLSLLPAAHDSIAPSLSLRATRKARWMARLRTVPADYLIIDVGPGHSGFAVDLMLSADVPICVTVPEPPAIETTFRFLRAAYRRRLRSALLRDKFRLNLVERALREIGHLPSPMELVRHIMKMDRALAELAWGEAYRMAMYLVVNQTRVRTDVELGSWTSALLARHHGLILDELGHVEYDDTVWLTVRRNKPLLVDTPTSKAARNVERIARRVLALATTPAQSLLPPPPLPTAEPTHYAVLGITRSSSDEEIRRAFKRQREVYATGSIAAPALLPSDDLARAQTRLAEAYDTLLDPIRRRAYDLSMFPETEPDARELRAPRPALATEQLMLQAELAREIGPETIFTGPLLKKVRESQGVELAEISARTKISRAHLAAIESEDFAGLPAAVYVRGFLTELAKFLKLDGAAVQRTYLRRMRERDSSLASS